MNMKGKKWENQSQGGKRGVKIKGKNESIHPLRMLTVKNAGSKLLIYCDMRKAVLKMSFFERNPSDVRQN